MRSARHNFDVRAYWCVFLKAGSRFNAVQMNLGPGAQYSRSMQRTTCALTLAIVCAGCAGNGEGLDANGRPLGESGSGADLFTQVQETIFTPACTICHAGAAAPLGLRLDAPNSRALLVGVPSVQVPSLLLVVPGDPAASYLVHKIEGRAAVGERMPLGGPALPQSSIDLLRQWIAAGAPGPAAALAAPLQPLRVVSTIPAAGERFTVVTKLVVIFSHDIDASLAQAGVFTLRASNGDEIALARIEVAASNPAVAMLRLPEALPADTYELGIRGTGATALADVDARALDGDGDGVPGGDYQVVFTITGAQP